MKKTTFELAIFFILPYILLAGCGLSATPTLTTLTTSWTTNPTVSPSETLLPVVMFTVTHLPTSSHTISPSVQPSLTLTKVPLILRGQVNVNHANCRYGPGAPYLYKYGLVGGSNLEIIARSALGDWIEIRAIGGDNPCWVKASLLNIKGNVMDVAYVRPEDVRLLRSPYYHPVTAAHAIRNGSEVTVTWNPTTLRAGDDSGQFPYLIEAWICISGQIRFTPFGFYDPKATITDEPGCSKPSYARLYAVEKHGYTKWIDIPWPATAIPTPDVNPRVTP